MRGGGWFTILATNVTGLTLHRLHVTAQRDGFDVVGCRRVSVDQVNITGGGDDAMVFKSDYSLGSPLHSTDLVVTNSVFGCGCNGLNFGSETVGNFSGVWWENITVLHAGKAGIGIVSMDGSHISNVTYRNISIQNAFTPLYMYIGARMRRPDANVSRPGSISGISISDVTSSSGDDGKKGNVTSAFDGEPGQPPFYIGPNIKLTNVRVTVRGGGAARDVTRDPPHFDDKYPPRYLGVRPAYGWFMRRLRGVSLVNVTLGYETQDSRPAFVLDDARDIRLDDVCVMPGHGYPWDVVLRNGSEVVVGSTARGCTVLRVEPKTIQV